MTLPDPESLLGKYLGARAQEASDVAWLRDEAAKNQMLRFRVGDEARVLKIFSHSWRYSLTLLKNPASRYWHRNFKLRGTSADRVKAELEADAGFRAAGLGAFEIVERPTPDALVFRFYEGQTAQRLITDRADPAFTTSLVEQIAEDFAQRQQLAVARNDKRLVHPDPCLKHVWITPEGERLQFDFEGRVNPSLPLEELLARETEVFVFQVSRSGVVGEDDMQRLVSSLGPEVRERWRTQAASPIWGRSKSNQRRVPEVEAFMG